MATDNTQLEKQALESAYEELEKAKGVFAQQLEAYEKAGDALVQDMQDYKTQRKRWLM